MITPRQIYTSSLSVYSRREIDPPARREFRDELIGFDDLAESAINVSWLVGLRPPNERGVHRTADVWSASELIRLLGCQHKVRTESGSDRPDTQLTWFGLSSTANYLLPFKG